MKHLAIIISLFHFQACWAQSLTELKNIGPELGEKYEVLEVQTSADEELLRFISYDSVSSYKEKLKKLSFFETEGEIAFLKGGTRFRSSFIQG